MNLLPGMSSHAHVNYYEKFKIYGVQRQAEHRFAYPTNITDTHNTPTISVRRLPMERYGLSTGIR